MIPGLSRLASGSASIVLPGDEIVYKVSVRAGEFVALETEFDGLGQSLVALQTGLTTGAAFLSRFGTNPSAAWMQTDRWIISADAASTSVWERRLQRSPDARRAAGKCGNPA